MSVKHEDLRCALIPHHEGARSVLSPWGGRGCSVQRLDCSDSIWARIRTVFTHGAHRSRAYTRSPPASNIGADSIGPSRSVIR